MRSTLSKLATMSLDGCHRTKQSSLSSPVMSFRDSWLNIAAHQLSLASSSSEKEVVYINCWPTHSPASSLPLSSSSETPIFESLSDLISSFLCICTALTIIMCQGGTSASVSWWCKISATRACWTIQRTSKNYECTLIWLVNLVDKGNFTHSLFPSIWKTGRFLQDPSWTATVSMIFNGDFMHVCLLIKAHHQSGPGDSQQCQATLNNVP